MKYAYYILLIFFALVNMISCGIIFPNVATIIVKNETIKTQESTATGLELSNVTFDYNTSIQKTIGVDSEETLSISWYGSNKVSTPLTFHYTLHGDITKYAIEHISIQNFDRITITILTDNRSGYRIDNIKREQ